MYLYVTEKIKYYYKIGIAEKLWERLGEYRTLIPDLNCSYEIDLPNNVALAIEKAFKNSLVFPFLTVWSIGNDILSLVTDKKEEDGIEYVVCDFKDETTIMFYKQDNKYFIDQDLKKLIGGLNLWGWNYA